MDVEMRHLLPGVHPGIGEEAVAGLDQTRVAGDPADGADEAGDLAFRGPAGEIVPRHVSALGDDEDVDRLLRLDVVEGERMLVLMDLAARYLAAQDAGEDIGLVIGAG